MITLLRDKLLLLMDAVLISTSNAAAYYATFYTLAFLVSFIILVIEGRKRKFPVLSWLIVITTGFVFFVLGCRVVTLSSEDWSRLVSNGLLDHSNGMTMLGGLLLSVPAILIVKRLVGFDASALDAYAFVLPVGMCVQRLGCFFNGCCFGTITGGWGVQYPRGNYAFLYHDSYEILSPLATHSLAIHPVQLYESIGCLLAVFILYKTRNRFKSAGSLFYLSGLLYYVVRFTTEFIRDPNAHAWRVSSWWGLNTIQWLMLVLIVASMLIITVKERFPSVKPRQYTDRISFLQILSFLALSVAFFLCSKWLSPTEILVTYIALFYTAAYLLVELFRTITVPQLRLTSLSLLLLSLALMSQTHPELASSDSTRISYNTISIGGLVGQQDLTIGSITTTDCNGNPTTVPAKAYYNDYQVFGAGYSRTVQKGKDNNFTFGISAFKGTHTEIESQKIYGFNPYIQRDWPGIGLGVGAHVGDLTMLRGDAGETSVSELSAYPQLYLRFGKLRSVFGEISLARNFPTSFPSQYFNASLGFGFSSRRTGINGAMRFGTSSSTAFFLSSSIPMGKHVMMEPTLGFGASFFLKDNYDEVSGFLGSINLHYKFGKKPVAMK